MRRAGVPVQLLKLVPAQHQGTHQGALMKLQALFLHAAGNTGFPLSLISELPSVLSRSLFGAAIKAEDLKNLKRNPYLEDHIVSLDRRYEDSIGSGFGEPLSSAVRAPRKRSRHSPPLDDVTALTLSRRARRPGAAALLAARVALARDRPRNPPSPSGLPGDSLLLDPPPSGDKCISPDDLLPASGLSAAAAAPTSALEAHTSAPPPPPPAGTSLPGPLTTSEVVPGPNVSLNSLAVTPWSSLSYGSCGLRNARAGLSPRSETRFYKSINELLDDLEHRYNTSGSLPQPPSLQLVVDLFERWRRTRREAEQGRRQAAVLAARLDRLVAPHLRGDYGAGMEPRTIVFFLWTLVKSGLFGDATLALAKRLEELIRPDMSYTEGEYWASLAFYTLGLAQQAAAAGAGAGGARAATTAAAAIANNSTTRHTSSSGSGSSSARGRWDSPAVAAAALVEQSRHQLAPALLMLLGRNANTINQQALSNTFWAAGLLQMRDYRRHLAPLAVQAYVTAAQAQSQNISNIMYGCAVLGLDENQWATVQGAFPFLERLVSESVRRKLKGFQPPEVSCLTWSACKLGLKLGPLLEVVANFIGQGGFDQVSSAQVWANSLYAMGLSDFYHPRVFQKLSEALLEQRPGRNQSSTSLPPPPSSTAAASSQSHSYQPARWDTAGADAFSAVLQKPPLHVPAILCSATSQTCSNLLFALGALRHVDEQIVDLLMARMRALVLAGRSSVMDVALAVRASAQINYRSALLDELLEAAMPAMKAHAPRLMSYNILWSMLTLNMLDEPRHQPLVQYLVSCVNQYGTTTWKSMATDSVSRLSARPSGPGSDAAAYDDLTQLVQYHVESRYLGLTGEAYDLQLPQGIDAVVGQIRAYRQKLAAQSSTVVHQKVVGALREMAAAPDSVTAGIRHPRIVKVESEVMVEPELVMVDVLLTLAYQDSNPNPDLCLNSDYSDPSPTGPASAAASTTYQVALEVDGPHHFMRNRPNHQDGPTAYRDRVLQRRFGGVVVVPTRVWVDQLTDDKSRRRHLAELLRATVPPPSPH